MKTRAVAFALLLIAFAVPANAITLPMNFQNWFFIAAGCSTFVPPTPPPDSDRAVCLDSLTGALYVWGGSSWSIYTSTNLASPGAIGGTTPAAGTFTALTGTVVTGTTSINATTGAPISSDGGTAPTITAGCVTTGGSVTGTNNAGTITTGSSAATTCTMTFNAATAFAVAPTCVFTDANASITPVAYSAGAASTTTVVVDFVSASSKKINYVCIGG
jgi:hypothetical protein